MNSCLHSLQGNGFDKATGLQGGHRGAALVGAGSNGFEGAAGLLATGTFA
eukprot:CAMPEP_0170595064 /NCGR_PEP_ID=MMETSP0224-20130122/14345_1 /TAXON_ID=285029 /ORGANISM="Togula jolla, Strain CCCM 725" /LENGTH=49 /DNA_ID=CAMNT_0010919185 /DNA_START=182 /DNA_END=331 /DNA_ORIENTATION=-